MSQLTAQAVWYASPGLAEVRAEPLPSRRPDEVLIRARYSGVSRGTERLVLAGSVEPGEYMRMRCPLQGGSFPFPIKYGYALVGDVVEGDPACLGRTVFVLHPHQDLLVVPSEAAVSVPAEIPPKRAVLAANMETALNALWDGGVGPANRVAVIGAGVVGLLAAHLAARIPGCEVTISDINEARRGIAEALGCRFALPLDAPAGCDVVFHTSASAEGLETAIQCAGFEAKIIELSWYGGSSLIPARLGGAFHSQRLQIVSSQVGHVAPNLRPRWPPRRRLEAALRLLAAEQLDLLVEEEILLRDVPRELPPLLTRDAPGLAPVIRYPSDEV